MKTHYFNRTITIPLSCEIFGDSGFFYLIPEDSEVMQKVKAYTLSKQRREK